MLLRLPFSSPANIFRKQTRLSALNSLAALPGTLLTYRSSILLSILEWLSSGLSSNALKRLDEKQIEPGIAWPESLSDEVVVAHTGFALVVPCSSAVIHEAASQAR